MSFYKPNLLIVLHDCHYIGLSISCVFRAIRELETIWQYELINAMLPKKTSSVVTIFSHFTFAFACRDES